MSNLHICVARLVYKPPIFSLILENSRKILYNIIMGYYVFQSKYLLKYADFVKVSILRNRLFCIIEHLRAGLALYAR